MEGGSERWGQGGGSYWRKSFFGQKYRKVESAGDGAVRLQVSWEADDPEETIVIASNC